MQHKSAWWGKSAGIVGVMFTLAACGLLGSKLHQPPKPLVTPKVGECRNLTFAAVTASTNQDPTVSCDSSHTAVTVSVGKLAENGQTAAMDLNSATLQNQLAAACPAAVLKHVGGGRDRLDLSRIEAILFMPTDDELKRGANWYRCDLVVVGKPKILTALPRTMNHVLAKPTGLDRWGICGTAAPSAPSFSRIICSMPHTWRAVALVTLPTGVKYLDAGTTNTARDNCRKIALSAAKGAAKYTWSFEWPNAEQWESGQRFGLCWLPTSP